jgi:large subunit ribosomal protein L21
MYAVIKTGGKQYRVAEGDILKIEDLNVEVGENVNFLQVLMISKDDKLTVGTPFVKDGVVTAEVLANGRHKKIRIIKFRRRKHHMKRMGHRQNFTQVKITSIGK